jgi:hypothetical protein
MQIRNRDPIRFDAEKNKIEIDGWEFGFGEKLDALICPEVQSALENALQERPPTISLGYPLDLFIELWAFSDSGVPMWRTSLADVIRTEMEKYGSRDEMHSEDFEGFRNCAAALRSLADEIDQHLSTKLSSP